MIKAVHDELLMLLSNIHTICVDNDIKYSLFAGTLIGAVRHKGFIPWDDDADVVFERKEYLKFISVLPDDFEVFLDPWVPRFKLRGDTNLYVDIFIFDSISEIPLKQNLHILKLKFLQGTLKSTVTINKGLSNACLSVITYCFGFLFSNNLKLKWYDKIASSVDMDSTCFMFSSFDQFKYIKHILPKSVVSEYKLVTFENINLMIISDYDSYLTVFYGDYMQLPDVSKRIPEHGNVNV